MKALLKRTYLDGEGKGYGSAQKDGANPDGIITSEYVRSYFCGPELRNEAIFGLIRKKVTTHSSIPLEPINRTTCRYQQRREYLRDAGTLKRDTFFRHDVSRHCAPYK